VFTPFCICTTTAALYFAPVFKTKTMLRLRHSLIATGILILITILAVYCTPNQNSKDNTLVSTAKTTEEVSVEKGHHLVTAGGCHDCHSPKTLTAFGPKVDSAKMLSGHPADAPLPPINVAALEPGGWINFSPDLTAIVGPWGMSYAANITSDSATGIGAWKEENFVNAMRTGKHMGMENGRPIMPPMPWENLNHLSDNDLKSIFAYLKTTVPVTNRVHEPYSPAEIRQMAKAKK
jgi:mono/diheme cytochrome c family protein